MQPRRGRSRSGRCENSGQARAEDIVVTTTSFVRCLLIVSSARLRVDHPEYSPPINTALG